MSKHVLVLSTGPRVGGNSDTLADAVVKGALESGNQVEKINLHKKSLEFCIGCLVCQQTKRCVFHDDADKIVQKMMTSDVLVFATPVYFYGMCGQMMQKLLQREQ